MPGKTDRILGYLPGTFRPDPRRSVLRALAEAFGTELQQAENSLAAIMAAHWAKHADRGAKSIDDLACLASLYGLAPRDDEGIEEFREHFYRYVRTFLDGTVTVQGILRISAEALGLHIADHYEDMDVWWRRSEKELLTLEARNDDACQLIFGQKSVRATGRPAESAQVTGNIDLSRGVVLPAHATLKICIDDATPVEVILGETQPGKKELRQIVEAINARLGIDAARSDGVHLIIASPTAGAASKLEIQDIDNDAAEMLLGLAPLTYYGRQAASAEARGVLDLVSGIDLSEERFLRLAVDGIHLAEIDCAGPDPAHTNLDQICSAINSALKFPSPVASHDSGRLRLTSPSKGSGSSIAFQQPAAQDATSRLFGDIAFSHIGRDDQSARITGKNDIGGGIDMRGRFNIRLKIDEAEAVTVNCAGSDPANTRPSEIVSAINTAFRLNAAGHDGHHIILASPTTGPASRITLQTPSGQDATEDIFGIPPRTFSGVSAESARLSSLPWPEAGHDFYARNILKISVDGGSPVEIDLRAGAENPGAVLLNEKLIEVIKGACREIDVGKDNEKLNLVSSSTGSASILSIEPIESIKHRRFLTRAIINDEAAIPIFGFIAKEERGKAGSSACLKGKTDLRRGVDLSDKRYLRLTVDGWPAVDIDCAGKRPRATLIEEVVDKINDALCKIDANLRDKIATHDGSSLILTSPTTGAASRIELEPPLAGDALDGLLGIEPGMHRGKEATAIKFLATVDLSQGIYLAANSAIKLGLDGDEPVEIGLCGPEPCRKTLDEIVVAINIKLGFSLASHNGRRIALALPPSPDGIKIRQLVFAVPGSPDATNAIFGIEPLRSYRSSAASPAAITGTKDLSPSVDLSKKRYLQLSIDDGKMQAVDCAARAANPMAVQLKDIEESINAVFQDAATHNEFNHLIVKSRKVGRAGHITLERHISGDARQLLLGSVEDVTSGSDPAPAVITGERDLLKSVDLSARSQLRLKVDGERPMDIDIAGFAPEMTFLDDIVAAINRKYPNLAAATEDLRLKLTSPTSGEESSISLLPLRYLELQEYPPKLQKFPPDEDSRPAEKTVRHGDSWSLENKGASDVFMEAKITAPNGVVGPALVDSTAGWQLRLLITLDAGKTVRMWHDPTVGLKAEICTMDSQGLCKDKPISVKGEDILVGPLGGQAFVPFKGTWHMTGNGNEPAGLQLNDPLAARIVRLRTRRAAGQEIAVEVKESDCVAIDPEAKNLGSHQLPLIGRIRAVEGIFRLVDSQENIIVILREGPKVELEAYRDCVVSVTGSLYFDQPMLLIASRIGRLFDVNLRLKDENGLLIEENYEKAAIGSSLRIEDSLLWQINSGPNASGLVFAEEFDKAMVLSLPQGRSEWRYLECQSSRFNQAHFDAARFAGLECDGSFCDGYGIFNVSRFSNRPPESLAPLFAPSGTLPNPAVNVSFAWESHMPGAFIVNLPADLPERYGGRFNQARFGQGEGKPELYEKAVAQPAADERCIINLIKLGSKDSVPPLSPSALVKAEIAGFVPLGWKAVKMPFREPHYLTLGREDRPAEIYLSENGTEGFIKLSARENGAWGNEIAVSARATGPAMYDLSIIYKGARFENARQVVLGMGPPSRVSSCKKGSSSSKPQESASNNSLPALIREILKPRSIGVLQAKAAGLKAEVLRERTESIKDSKYQEIGK
jgi:hypothetical protein